MCGAWMNCLLGWTGKVGGEKGGINNLNERKEAYDLENKEHQHQEMITGFDRKKVLSEY